MKKYAESALQGGYHSRFAFECSNAAEAINGAGVVTVAMENRYVNMPVPGYESARKGEFAVLTVTDTGGGISPKDIGRIFEPFYTKRLWAKAGQA